MFQIKFGKFISSLRNEKGLTQDELAERLHISSGKTISKWENGNTLPDFDIIIQLSKELDISLYELSICEKIESKHITKEDILKIVDKKQLKRIALKKKLKLLLIFIIGIISLISIIFTVTNFNTTQVYTLQSGTSEFKISGSFTKTKDYSVFALTEIGYNGNDNGFKNIKVLNYDYALFYNNDKKIYHQNKIAMANDGQDIELKYAVSKINILIDSKTHNTTMITENNELKLIIHYKKTNDEIVEIKIPIKLIEQVKNNKLW